MAFSLQQKFVSLLNETSVFFETLDQNRDKDRAQILHLRQSALTLAAEAGTQDFGRFLAYLLGNTHVESHYPLQCIRMMSLIMHTLKRENLAKSEEWEELASAAFFADMGFRGAWLGHKGTHPEIALFRLKEMGLSWLSPRVEKLIAKHHEPAEDTSPQKIFSVISHYLGLAHGTGVDQGFEAIFSPSKAMEALIDEHPAQLDGVRSFLKAVSAFPLGAWIQLNSGDQALVIGANPVNPLRPRIGIYRRTNSGSYEWVEQDLQKELTRFITHEIIPSTAQRTLINNAHWITGWTFAGALGESELSRIFENSSHLAPGERQPATSITMKIQAMPTMAAPAAAAPEASPVAPAAFAAQAPAFPGASAASPSLPSTATSALAGSTPAPAAPTNEVAMLRSQWENQFKQMAEAINQLRLAVTQAPKPAEVPPPIAKIEPPPAPAPAVPSAEVDALRAQWENQFKQMAETINQLRQAAVQAPKPAEVPPPVAKVEPTPAPFAAPAAAPAVMPAVSATDPEAKKLLGSLYALIEHRVHATQEQEQVLRERVRVARVSLQHAYQEAQDMFETLESIARNLGVGTDVTKGSLHDLLPQWKLELQQAETMLSSLDNPSASSFSTLQAELHTATALTLEIQSSLMQPTLTQTQANALFARWKDYQLPAIDQAVASVQLEINRLLEDAAGRRGMLSKLKELTNSLKDFVGPKAAVSHVHKGIEYRQAGQLPEAIRQFEKAIELQPQSWEAHAYLGLCLLYQKDSRAAEELRKAVALKPDQTSLLDCLRLAEALPTTHN